MTSNVAYVVQEGGARTTAAQPAVAPLDSARNYFDAGVPLPASKAVIIHVRFWPDASIWEIAERPSSLTKEEWFNALCARFGGKYQTRAGGRGFFQISSTELGWLKAAH